MMVKLTKLASTKIEIINCYNNLFINAFYLLDIYLYINQVMSYWAIYISPHSHSLSHLSFASIYQSDEILTAWSANFYILMNHNRGNHFWNKQILSINIIKTIVKTFQNYYINLQNCIYLSQAYL